MKYDLTDKFFTINRKIVFIQDSAFTAAKPVSEADPSPVRVGVRPL